MKIVDKIRASFIRLEAWHKTWPSYKEPRHIRIGGHWVTDEELYDKPQEDDQERVDMKTPSGQNGQRTSIDKK